MSKSTSNFINGLYKYNFVEYLYKALVLDTIYVKKKYKTLVLDTIYQK